MGRLVQFSASRLNSYMYVQQIMWGGAASVQQIMGGTFTRKEWLLITS
jgi:hypothetical protein